MRPSLKLMESITFILSSLVYVEVALFSICASKYWLCPDFGYWLAFVASASSEASSGVLFDELDLLFNWTGEE